jgi:hypothetical protein
MHHQRRLHTERRTIARIDTLDFPGHQSIRDVTGTRATVGFRQRCTKHPERPHLGHDFPIEGLVAIGLKHARHQRALGVFPRAVTDHPLFVNELILEQQRIGPGKGCFSVTHRRKLP